MKGVIFTEFLEMVENDYSTRMADAIIGDCHLESGGAYTAVGTYPSTEMTALVAALAARTGESVPDLLRGYGRYLFRRFFALYPYLVSTAQDPMDFVAQVQGVIHEEVRKLYPDAELPQLDVSWPSADTLIVEYRSPRRLGDLAEGLCLGALDHLGHTAELARDDRDDVVVFTLTRLDPS